MSERKAKRFWKEASVVETDSGYGVELDGRPIRTPGNLPLIVPNRALAQSIAAEWDAQTGKIDPANMPLTRAANSALEKVAPQRAEVAAMLAAYADADLTCYRASSPRELVRRQSEAWDPLLNWAAEAYQARLIPVEGVIHHPQSKQALWNLSEPLATMSEFQLTGFHDLVTLTGSMIIGLAAVEALQEPEILWAASRIDEDWQAEQWGVDAEAYEVAEGKRRAFHRGLSFFRLSTKNC